MDINYNLVASIVGLLIFSFIFKKPLSLFFEKITNISFKRKNKKTEVELSISSSNKEAQKEELSVYKNKPIEEKTIEEEKIDFLTIHRLLSEQDFKGAEESYDRMKVETKNKKDKIFLERFYLYWSYYFNKDKDMSKLESLLVLYKNSDEENGKTLFSIGLLWMHDKNEERARKAFKESLDLNISDYLKSNVIIESSNLLEVTYFEKIAFIHNYIKSLNDNNAIYTLYYKIYEILKENNDTSASIILDKALSYTPNNLTNIFDVAYNHDDVNTQAKYYKHLINLNPKNEAALNNLGVCYDNLNLSFAAIDYYKKSIIEDNTLAASNISRKLIDAGFKEEAMEYLSTARKIENYHENIDHDLSTIRKNLNSEKEKKDVLDKMSTIRNNYFQKYADYFIKKIDKNLVEIQFICKSSSDKIEIKKINSLNEYIISYTKESKDYKGRCPIDNFGFAITLTHDGSILTTSKIDIWFVIKNEMSNATILIKSESNYEIYEFEKLNV